MSLSPTRFLVFCSVGLPLGFILTALGFAITGTPIDPAQIAPWAIGFALIIGILGSRWKKPE